MWMRNVITCGVAVYAMALTVTFTGPGNVSMHDNGSNMNRTVEYIYARNATVVYLLVGMLINVTVE